MLGGHAELRSSSRGGDRSPHHHLAGGKRGQEALSGTRKPILHLHGEYQQPESVVLGLASYQKVKDDPHAKAILQCSTLGQTMLFVGCGNTVLDPNFQQLIAGGTEALHDVVPRGRLQSLVIIKEFAKSDQHKDVLSEARNSLALWWKEDPATQVYLDGL